MTDKIFDFKPKQGDPYGVKFIGPFMPVWTASVNGYQVPDITAVVQDDNKITLCLDSRFIIDGTRDEVSKWLPFIANAMAVSAGYSCFGESSTERPNRFKLKLSEL